MSLFERRVRSVEDDNVSFFARLFGREPHPIACPRCGGEGNVRCPAHGDEECVDTACVGNHHPCPECRGIGEVMPLPHPALDAELANLAQIPIVSTKA